MRLSTKIRIIRIVTATAVMKRMNTLGLKLLRSNSLCPRLDRAPIPLRKFSPLISMHPDTKQTSPGQNHKEHASSSNQGCVRPCVKPRYYRFNHGFPCTYWTEVWLGLESSRTRGGEREKSCFCQEQNYSNSGEKYKRLTSEQLQLRKFKASLIFKKSTKLLCQFLHISSLWMQALKCKFRHNFSHNNLGQTLHFLRQADHQPKVSYKMSGQIYNFRSIFLS